MRVVTLNVNGIRAATAKGLVDWLIDQQADVICLQEVRCRPEQLPRELGRLEGYWAYWHPAEKPGYSGVGLLCREKPEDVQVGMGSDFDREGRFLRALFDGYSVASVYVPSGSSGPQRQAQKMRFLGEFLSFLGGLGGEQLLCGDFNIAHRPIDLKNWKSNQQNSGFLPEERAWIDDLLKAGYVDVFRELVGPDAVHYSWWSQRGQARAKNVGWRLDYHFSTPGLAGVARSPRIYPEPLLSDHAPVVIDYAL